MIHFPDRASRLLNESDLYSEIVSDDVMDFEYTPLPKLPGKPQPLYIIFLFFFLGL